MTDASVSGTLEHARTSTTTDTTAERTYIVLRATDDNAAWTPVRENPVIAASPDEAITIVAEKRTANDKAGTYVAVASRSWHQRKVRTETTTRLVVE